MFIVNHIFNNKEKSTTLINNVELNHAINFKQLNIIIVITCNRRMTQKP